MTNHGIDVVIAVLVTPVQQLLHGVILVLVAVVAQSSAVCSTITNLGVVVLLTCR